MSGFEATQAIRLLGPEFQKIPIIALTASATAGIREKCLEAGMNDCIIKPSWLKPLKEKLTEWLLPCGFLTPCKANSSVADPAAARSGFETIRVCVTGGVEITRPKKLSSSPFNRLEK